VLAIHDAVDLSGVDSCGPRKPALRSEFLVEDDRQRGGRRPNGLDSAHGIEGYPYRDALSRNLEPGCIGAVGGQPTPSLRDTIRRLREERGLSRSQLSRLTVGFDGQGIPEITIKSAENGSSQQTVRVLGAIAYGLGVSPNDWPEYRLAIARQQLDEREVGLDQALRNLSRIEGALAEWPG
jgi:transcriptional regulator with XRE-family HTH domain